MQPRPQILGGSALQLSFRRNVLFLSSVEASRQVIRRKAAVKGKVSGRRGRFELFGPCCGAIDVSAGRVSLFILSRQVFFIHRLAGVHRSINHRCAIQVYFNVNCAL